MSAEKVVSLQQFDLTADQFRQLPEDQQAVIAVLTYAVSELNALRRVFLSQRLALTEEVAINSAIKIQHFTILRTWTSKTFEAVQFLENDLCSSKRKCKDQSVLRLAKSLKGKLKEIRGRSGYSLARDIRNETANHYSFSSAKKNLQHTRNGSDCNFYTHDHGGNDFFPVGEEVVFQARLARRWSSVREKTTRDRIFRDGLTWNNETTDWLTKVNALFCSELVFKAFPQNRFRSSHYSAPAEISGHPSAKITPVFFEDSPQ